jgi:hypothetical protein
MTETEAGIPRSRIEESRTVSVAVIVDAWLFGMWELSMGETGKCTTQSLTQHHTLEINNCPQVWPSGSWVDRVKAIRIHGLLQPADDVFPPMLR